MSRIKLKRFVHLVLKESDEAFICYVVSPEDILFLIHLSRVSQIATTIVESVTLTKAYKDLEDMFFNQTFQPITISQRSQ